MKQKISFLMVLLLSASLLTGCGEEVPELTDEQTTLIAEYSVGLLKKYDKRSYSRLVDADITDELPEEKVIPTPMPSPVPEQEQQDTESESISDGNVSGGVADLSSIRDVSLASLIGRDDLSIQFVDWRLAESYTDEENANDYLGLDATYGNDLVILTYEITNNGASDVSLDMGDMNLRMRVNVNGEGKLRFMKTALPNDLLTFSSVIPAGESRKVVALSEVHKMDPSDVTSMVVTYVLPSGKTDVKVD